MIASFVFELDTYCVNGYAAHANGSVAAEARPAEAASEQRQSEQREQVEERAPSRARPAGGPTSRSSRTAGTPGMYDS